MPGIVRGRGHGWLRALAPPLEIFCRELVGIAREAGRPLSRAVLGVIEGAPCLAVGLALTYGVGADPPGVGASVSADVPVVTKPNVAHPCATRPHPRRDGAWRFSSQAFVWGAPGEGKEKSRAGSPPPRPAQTNGLRWLDRQRRTKAGRHRSLDVRDVALLFPPSRRAFEEWGNKSAGRRLGGYGREWAMDGPRSVSSRQGRLPKPTRPCPSGRRTTT